MTAAFWKQWFFFSGLTPPLSRRRSPQAANAAGIEVVLKITCNSCFNTSPKNTSPLLRKEFTRTDSAHSCKLTGSNSQNGARLEHTLQRLWHNNNTITKLPPNNALMVSRWHIRSLSRLILSFFFVSMSLVSVHHFVNSYPSILYKSDYLTCNTLW